MVITDLHRPSRHLAFGALFNVRDLGGLRGRSGQTIRWRSVYRADGLHRADADDLERLGWLGLATVVDLRTPAEVAESRFPADRLAVGWHHQPLIETTWHEAGLVPEIEGDTVGFLFERYCEMLDAGGPAIAATLDILARPSQPLVFHCAAGKDRTGVMAAVLLGLLGVHDDDIVEDYTMSLAAMRSMTAWLTTNRPDVAEAMADRAAFEMAAPPEVMRLLLGHVREEHGSMVGYVRSIGVPFPVVEELHHRLLV